MKDLTKLQKLFLRLAMSGIKTASDATEFQNENVEKVVNKAEDLAQKSVDILTDDNKDNEAQFKALFEEEKHELLDLGLDIAKDECHVISNPTTKAVVLAAISILKEAFANPHAKLSEQDLVDFLQTANLEVQEAKL